MFEGQISGSSDDGKPVVLKPTLACMCASPPAPAEVRMIREGHILSDSPQCVTFAAAPSLPGRSGLGQKNKKTKKNRENINERRQRWTHF